MGLTYKQKFNKKHGQPLDTANSLTKIARLSGISYKNIKKIFEKGEAAYFTNPESVRKSVTNPQQWGPDGNFKYAKTEKNQHDDHIMPLAYGGTNEEINHQILSSRENLSKSSSIPFENIMDINPLLLCSRWRPILYTAQREKINITVFKSRMSYAIREEQKKYIL